MLAMDSNENAWLSECPRRLVVHREHARSYRFMRRCDQAE